MGDEVKIYRKIEFDESGNRIGIIGKIKILNYQGGEFPIMLDNGYCVSLNQIYLIKEATPMSKYEDLKGRIEKLDNGWTKEADDILKEMFPEKGGVFGKQYRLVIPAWNEKDACLEIMENSRYLTTFYFTSQCSKNKAFKSALLWLLDHSDIKNEKAEKIAELEKKIEELKNEVDRLK